MQGSLPAQWTVLVLTDRGLYARWLYEHIRSFGWQPFMRINKQGHVRPAGQSLFRSLASRAPQAGSAWCGKVACFSQEASRLSCTLLARWEVGYQDVWLIVTDLEPAQAAVAWYGMSRWIEAGFTSTKRGGWHWHQTKMVDPVRAERVWFAIAVATQRARQCGWGSRCQLAGQSLGSVARNPCGTAPCLWSVPSPHAQLFCARSAGHCWDVAPRRRIAPRTVSSRTLAGLYACPSTRID